jgi:general secretion pathway protein A
MIVGLIALDRTTCAQIPINPKSFLVKNLQANDDKNSMYEEFYGLRERAFSLTPDPQFLFLNDRSKEALEQILYGIERREGFSCLIGDVGTGKTTLCWAILEKLKRKNVRTALIQNPMLSETDILRPILMDLGVRPSAEDNPSTTDESNLGAFDSSWLDQMDKKQLLDRLNAFLLEKAQRDEFTILIIDESQNLSVKMLEELRLLSNLETAKRKLLQIIFVGQPELDEKLKRPELRQLNSRISVRFETKRLDAKDTEKYILHRLIMAGGAPKLQFGHGAIRAVYEYSRGYPRLINLVCDRALLAGYGERSFLITKKMIRNAAMSIEGKEDIILHPLSNWMRKVIPIAGTAILLIVLSLLFAWKNGLITLAKDSAPAPPAAYSEPMKAAMELPVSVATPPVSTPVSTPKPETAATEEKPATKQLPLETVATTPAIPEKHGEKLYVLQVHSFLTEDKANPAMKELKNEGQLSYLQYEINSEGKGWYVVYVGPFNNLGAARKTLDEIQKRYGVEPIIRIRSSNNEQRETL